MSNNKNFFAKKRAWSLVKDELLRCYLAPYLNKIYVTRKPLLYVDCFAGKGKFDDGKEGSPLVAISCVRDSLARFVNADYSRGFKPLVFMRFIEKHYAKELEANISAEEGIEAKVKTGKYEEIIVDLLKKAISRFDGNLNVFLYVDPYGIKALDAELFCSLPSVVQSAELLLNLNSVGFIREALRVRKITLKENEAELLADLEELDMPGTTSIQDLNRVAGGDYWQDIVDDYKTGLIDFYEAEKRFSAEYKQMLRKSYRYVLDMPIRIKAGQNPKYRMVHATNHPDGCLLMADNVFKRTEYLIVDIQQKGQMSFIEQSIDNDPVDMTQLEEKMGELVATLEENEWVSLKLLLADFFNRYGGICAQKHLTTATDSALKCLEKKGVIEVRRTDNSGQNKASRAWTESSKLVIHVKRR